MLAGADRIDDVLNPARDGEVNMMMVVGGSSAGTSTDLARYGKIVDALNRQGAFGKTQVARAARSPCSPRAGEGTKRGRDL